MKIQFEGFSPPLMNNNCVTVDTYFCCRAEPIRYASALSDNIQHFRGKGGERTFPCAVVSRDRFMHKFPGRVRKHILYASRSPATGAVYAYILKNLLREVYPRTSSRCLLQAIYFIFGASELGEMQFNK